MAFSTPRMSRPSQFPRTSPTRARSPVRSEQALLLKQVIGTTATSSNGFSAVASKRSFALVAGGGGLLLNLDDGGQLTQRFYHARPTVSPLVTTPSIYESPTPASHQGSRHRTAASLRESGYGTSSAGYPFSDAFDSPNPKAGSSSRTKAATCVALSPDGKLMAVGETGHKPRVLLFLTAKDSPRDVPQNALSEHTFGVRCLAFSPDSQYLASLGDTNDGFLYIWTINQKTRTAQLKASNKCTSSIKQIAWMGNNLLTIGTRHVKIWRLDQPTPTSPSKRFSDAGFAFASPSSRTLFGRNCLLGPLLDKKFTAVVAISHVQAIVCSDAGDVCLLDDGPTPSFTKIADCGFPVTALITAAREYVLIAGIERQMRRLNTRSQSGLLLPDSEYELHEARLDNHGKPVSSAMALGLVGDSLIMVDQARNLHLYDSRLTTEERSFALKQSFPAHPSAVLGIRSISPVPSTTAFMTWSIDGTVLGWDVKGAPTEAVKVALDQVQEPSDEYVNELRVATTVGKGAYLVTGDRLGVLRITEKSSRKSVYESKAHGNEVTDIAVFEAEDDVLIATASRDRTVQVFRWDGHGRCEHLQTIEEHTGAVTSVRFSPDGNTLVSASSDRTLMLLDAVPNRSDGQGKVLGFLAKRPINLKASPVSLAFAGPTGNALLLSTGDRQISRYDIATGNFLGSFKTADQEGGDPVILGAIAEISDGPKSFLIAGVSTSDKSLRIYDANGRLLEKEHGHTEGMMGITAITTSEAGSSKSMIVTIASDGTIFLWDLVPAGQQLQEAFSAISLGGIEDRRVSMLGSRPPLRRVLSSSELTRLVEVREESGSAPATPNSARKPPLRQKTSKLSLMQTPRLDPPSLPGSGRRSVQQSPIDSGRGPSTKRSVSTMVRSPSPTMPARKAQTMRISSRSTPVPPQPRRKSMSAASSPSAPNGLTVSTDALCRSLHTYRKKLSTSTDILALDSVRELERELTLTAKVLAEKSARNETVMAKILDQYSEKLVGMLDEKIEASISRRMRVRDEADDSNGNDGNDGNDE